MDRAGGEPGMLVVHEIFLALLWEADALAVPS